jgi:spermidine/putrescine transport system ATP-binding protein
MSDAKVRLVNVVKEFPSRDNKTNQTHAVDNVSYEVYDGEFFAMLGPSGCGKTTTLRMIAGFEQPSQGNILIDNLSMQNVPSYLRPVNTVFQDYVLFPHMSVLQNVMFGLQMSKVDKKESLARAQEALEMVRLPQVGKRKPRELSGGQQQRVALARALVNQPSVLLLDEPLGALDLKLRREMQQELKDMQVELGITFIYVTHDQEEALTMADRIAVMEGGKVLQIGTPSDIYETPATRFVADFIGETNFIEATLTSGDGKNGVVSLDADTTFAVNLPEYGITHGQHITVAIRPERIQLHEQTHTLNDDQHVNLMGQIQQIQYIGTDTRYTVRVGNASLKVRVQNTDYQKSLIFKDKQFVRVVWHKDNARVLTE